MYLISLEKLKDSATVSHCWKVSICWDSPQSATALTSYSFCDVGAECQEQHWNLQMMTLAYCGNTPGFLPLFMLLACHWRPLNLPFRLCSRCVSVKYCRKYIGYKSSSFWNAYSLLVKGINYNGKLILLYIKLAHLIILLLPWQGLYLNLVSHSENSTCPIKIL